jgi:tryptophan synthase alpha chain
LSRLAALFSSLKKQGRKALVPYIVAGDPDPSVTVKLMHELVRQGADIIELGVPFSDPMAEGPVIQLAHERSLAHHVSLTMALAMVAEFRESDSKTAIVLMGYANPIERMGYQVFAERAAAVGLDGLLTVDMPPEEAEEPSRILRAAGIDNIFLLAPTTDNARIEKIAALASGYLYCVALKGVTGAGNLDIASVTKLLNNIKAHTELPITVGFGIKDGASAAALAPLCEGVVVGSALIERLVSADRSQDDNAWMASVAGLIGEMRTAIDA